MSNSVEILIFLVNTILDHIPRNGLPAQNHPVSTTSTFCIQQSPFCIVPHSTVPRTFAQNKN
jgi:hypothetical protein